MIKRQLLLWLFILPFFAFGQHDTLKYYLDNHPRFLTKYNDTLTNPFAGGLRNPQFNNFDLNNDSLKDLVIFDGKDKRILTFIKSIDSNKYRYSYSPEYEQYFPSNPNLDQALLIRDYNNDGKPDLFYVVSSSSLKVFKNISDSIPRFTKITDEVQSLKVWKSNNNYDTTKSRIFSPNTDIPGITDIDGDGDLDILTYDIVGPYLRYFRNLADEKQGITTDSLDFILEDRCWGSFREGGGVASLPETGINCSDIRVNKKHSGSNILPIDMDNDQDMDLLYGDVGFDSLAFLENGKSDFSHPIDTMYKATFNFPESHPVQMREFLSAHYVNIDENTTKDLVITPQSEQAGRSLNQVKFYENTGTTQDPDFEYVKNTLLQETMIDLGGSTAPAFFDYNNDSAKDLLISTSGGLNQALGSPHRLVLYENINTNKRPVYKVKDHNYLSLESDSIIAMTPAFGDLDNDGDKDLVLGNSEGKLIYYENTTENGEEASFNKITENLDNIDIGRQSSPTIGDINNDSKNDLVVGTDYKYLLYFENNGLNSGIPTFKQPDTIGQEITKRNLQYIAPHLADLDNNDTFDLIIGSRLGKLSFYFNIENHLNGKFPRNDSLLKLPTQEKLTTKYFGLEIYPAVNNQDSDSMPDIYLGNSRGGLIYLGSQDKRDTIISPNLSLKDAEKETPIFSLYPNPSSKYVILEFKKELERVKRFKLIIQNINGERVMQQNLSSQSEKKRINTSKLANGVYILSVNRKSGRRLWSEKLLIIHN